MKENEGLNIFSLVSLDLNYPFAPIFYPQKNITEEVQKLTLKHEKEGVFISFESEVITIFLIYTGILIKMVMLASLT